MSVRADRYVNCMGCGYIVSGLANELLVCDMDCPECGAKKQFGPTIYVKDFIGHTLKDALQRRIDRNRTSTRNAPQ